MVDIGLVESERGETVGGNVSGVCFCGFVYDCKYLGGRIILAGISCEWCVVARSGLGHESRDGPS